MSTFLYMHVLYILPIALYGKCMYEEVIVIS